MDNNLIELSKPVVWASQRHIDTRHRISAFTDEESARGEGWQKVAPLYSQEYVSALLQRIAELEQKERHTERQDVIDGLAGAGEAWSDIEEYMVKWDEERRNG